MKSSPICLVHSTGAGFSSNTLREIVACGPDKAIRLRVSTVSVGVARVCASAYVSFS